MDPNTEKMQKIAFDIFSTTFNSAYNAMLHFQEQNEKTCENMIGMIFRQLECCKEESLNTFKDWVDGVQHSRREFKSAIDEGYSLMRDIMRPATSTAKRPKEKK
jgi:hypothetical protein